MDMVSSWGVERITSRGFTRVSKFQKVNSCYTNAMSVTVSDLDTCVGAHNWKTYETPLRKDDSINDVNLTHIKWVESDSWYWRQVRHDKKLPITLECIKHV